MFGLSQHPFSRVCHHSNPASARKVDEPWTKCRNPTDVDWTRALAHDGRDPRSWPRTKPCRGQHVLEQSYTANQHGAWISCARCALRLHYIPRHTARMTSVSTPSSASVQEALKRMSLWRDNDFTTKAVRDMIAEVEGRKPPRKARCSLTKKISDDFSWSSSNLIIRLYFLVGVRHRHRCERAFSQDTKETFNSSSIFKVLRFCTFEPLLLQVPADWPTNEPLHVPVHQVSSQL